MKELSIEEKAKAYDEAIEKASIAHKDEDRHLKATLERIFPALKESEDKRMIQYFKDLAPFDKADELYSKYGFSHKDAIAWLEKQSENVPSRNMILSVWELGNEWKELTNGRVTEYGTQLEYIQKHWNESEYYLRDKQGEQKPAWKPSDEQMLALEAVLTVSPQSPAMTSALIELYQQLKELKG